MVCKGNTIAPMKMAKVLDIDMEYFDKEFLKNIQQFLRKSKKSGYFPTAPPTTFSQIKIICYQELNW